MQSRLITFLSDFERMLQANNPSPDDGSWMNNRTVNYRKGLAQIQLNVSGADQAIKQRGHVLLQSYQLADGSPCLKVSMTWAESECTSGCVIFPKPGKDWKSEAKRLATEWMAGPPEVVQTSADAEPVMAEPVLAEAATG